MELLENLPKNNDHFSGKFVPTDNLNTSNLSDKMSQNSQTSQKSQKYRYENDSKVYDISLVIVDNKIKITVNPKPEDKFKYYYENEFSQEELNRIHKIFKLCSNIDDSYEYFIDIFNVQENKPIIKEYDNNLNIEKKFQISQPLKIEISKKFLDTNNKTDEKIINLNDLNLLHGDNFNDLKSKGNKTFEDEIKNQNSKNTEKICQISDNFHFLENLLEKEKDKTFLEKKRENVSENSDFSYIANENELLSRKNKSKNSLEKEKLLKIFSEKDKNKEKFFAKIHEKKKLEEKNNTQNIKPAEKSIILEEENELDEDQENNFLFSPKEENDGIKDELNLLNQKSKEITPQGQKIQVNDNIPPSSLANPPNQIIFKNNNNNINEIFNQNDFIKNDDKLMEENNRNWNMNYLNNGYSDRNKKVRKLTGTSYKIMTKNSFELVKFVKKCKIYSFDSDIVSNFDELDFTIDYLKNKFDKEIINAIRIYKATEDGDRAEDFHKNCDDNTNIIVLIKTKDGKKFGGYTSIGFNNFYKSYLDDTTFIFSVDKREIYPNIKGKYAIESNENYGPVFSGDTIKIYDNFLKNGGITTKTGVNYQMNEEFQLNDGKRSFAIEELEVFEFLELKNDNNI